MAETPPRPDEPDEPDEPTQVDESTDGGQPDGDDDLRERVLDALDDVPDPRLDGSVVEAGLVRDVRIEDGSVTVEASLADFDGDATPVLQSMTAAVNDVPAVVRGHVEPVGSTDDRVPGVAAFDRVIAVASAKGGVGKSTVATTLACALADEDDVALFDADVHGPNVPRLLDVSGPIRSTDAGNPLPVDAGGLDVMSVGLMAEGTPLGWRGAMAHDAVSELYEETAWKRTDTLVVDLPPGTGDVVLTTLETVPVDGVVVVSTPFPSAVDDTARTVELFRDEGIPVLGTVVNMAGFTCPSCGDTHDLFEDGDPVAEFDAEVLAELPFDRAMQATPSVGAIPDYAADLADAVRAAVETAGDVDAPAHAVDVRGLPGPERKTRVRERFATLEPGESFTMVSDRDPTPVREFLASLADCHPSEVAVTVSREAPDAWLLRTERPA